MPDLKMIIINGKEFTGFVSPIERMEDGEDYKAIVGRKEYMCKRRKDGVYVGISIIKDDSKPKEKRRRVL